MAALETAPVAWGGGEVTVFREKGGGGGVKSSVGPRDPSEGGGMKRDSAVT